MGSLQDYNNTNYTFNSYQIGNTWRQSQSFFASNDYFIGSVVLGTSKVGTVSGTSILINIRNVDENHKPSGAILSYGSQDITLWSSDISLNPVTMSPYELTSGVEYSIEMIYPDSEALDYIAILRDDGNSYPGYFFRSNDSGATWSDNTNDAIFEVWSTIPGSTFIETLTDSSGIRDSKYFLPNFIKNDNLYASEDTYNTFMSYKTDNVNITESSILGFRMFKEEMLKFLENKILNTDYRPEDTISEVEILTKKSKIYTTSILKYTDVASKQYNTFNEEVLSFLDDKVSELGKTFIEQLKLLDSAVLGEIFDIAIVEFVNFLDSKEKEYIAKREFNDNLNSTETVSNQFFITKNELSQLSEISITQLEKSVELNENINYNDIFSSLFQTFVKTLYILKNQNKSLTFKSE